MVATWSEVKLFKTKDFSFRLFAFNFQLQWQPRNHLQNSPMPAFPSNSKHIYQLSKIYEDWVSFIFHFNNLSNKF